MDHFKGAAEGQRLRRAHRTDKNVFIDDSGKELRIAAGATETHFGVPFSRCNILSMIDIADRGLQASLARFGIAKVAATSVLAGIARRIEQRRGLTIALERASQRGLDALITAWVEAGLQALASDDASDTARASAAEVEAALRLSWVGSVSRPTAGKRPTCDFRVSSLNVEVYCPQAHVEERRVVQADLAKQAKVAQGPVSVAIAIGYPATGSGRTVASDGRVVHDPASQAASFPANKLMDRLLSRKKREATQFVDGEANILWLDLKYGLEFCAVNCLPLRSLVSKGTCFVGMNGVWQAFYGCKGDPLFAERTVLEYPVKRVTYEQQREGWFRETPRVASVIISVLDGVIRFDNPWASAPLTSTASALLTNLSELRPEFSWFDDEPKTLESRIAAERRRVECLARSPQLLDSDREGASERS